MVSVRRLIIGLLMLTTGVLPGASAQTTKVPQLDKLKVPPGFKVEVYKDNIENARSMTLSPSGTLFVGTTRKGFVYAVVDKDKDGKADEVFVIARNLDLPNGVAFRNGSLYVAELNRVIRFDNIEQHLKDPPAPVVVSTNFPDKRHHGWKFIRFSPDDKLYVPVGAPCNVCMRNDPFAAISRMKPDGSEQEVFARGIRNTVGFDWHPVTGQLWFTDNGRDLLNDTTPPDELNCAPQAGMHFGFPFFFGNNVPDPEFGSRAPANLKPVPPRYPFAAHVAALGMRFYTGKMFPAEYKNQIFVAQHGSWNSSKKVGYQVMCVKLDGEKVVSATPFLTGFLQPGEQVLGRPVDVQVMPDGALLVSDDDAGAIYRVSYQSAMGTDKGSSKAAGKAADKGTSKAPSKAPDTGSSKEPGKSTGKASTGKAR